VMYMWKCKLCNEIYIGYTNGPIQIRYKQHISAIRNVRPRDSALSEHLLDKHNHTNVYNNPSCFTFSIIERNFDYLINVLREARFIYELDPKINRKKEQPWWIDSEVAKAI